MSRMCHIKRFLACHRGSVALESVIASIPLLLCLVGVFEIVQAIFADDLLQRAAYRVARRNAIAMAPASDAAEMESRVGQAIAAEIGHSLDYELKVGADCPEPQNDQQNQAEYCLSAKIEVYTSPADLTNGQQLEPSEVIGYGGGSSDLVVVRLRLVPRSVLSELKRTLFSTAGLRAVAVIRNETREV